MRKPKYFLVRGLGPAGQPHGKAVGHVEVYGTDVPYCERYVAFRYRPVTDASPKWVRPSIL
jgi:hypothetical protein